jgi:hypothetical protein
VNEQKKSSELNAKQRAILTAFAIPGAKAARVAKDAGVSLPTVYALAKKHGVMRQPEVRLLDKKAAKAAKILKARLGKMSSLELVQHYQSEGRSLNDLPRRHYHDALRSYDSVNTICAMLEAGAQLSDFARPDFLANALPEARFYINAKLARAYRIPEWINEEESEPAGSGARK